MKKIVSFLLAALMVLSLGSTVLAAGSPTGNNNAGVPAAPAAPAAEEETAEETEEPGMGVFNEDGEQVGTIPADAVKKISVDDADELDDEDKEAFLAAYETAKKMEGKVVKYCFWLDIPEEYKTEDLAYVLYEFTCTGKNVQVFVNDKEMEVEETGKNAYAAKLTEFGAVAILCD